MGFDWCLYGADLGRMTPTQLAGSHRNFPGVVTVERGNSRFALKITQGELCVESVPGQSPIHADIIGCSVENHQCGLLAVDAL